MNEMSRSFVDTEPSTPIGLGTLELCWTKKTLAGISRLCIFCFSQLPVVYMCRSALYV